MINACLQSWSWRVPQKNSAFHTLNELGKKPQNFQSSCRAHRIQVVDGGGGDKFLRKDLSTGYIYSCIWRFLHSQSRTQLLTTSVREDNRTCGTRCYTGRRIQRVGRFGNSQPASSNPSSHRARAFALYYHGHLRRAVGQGALSSSLLWLSKPTVLRNASPPRKPALEKPIHSLAVIRSGSLRTLRRPSPRGESRNPSLTESTSGGQTQEHRPALLGSPRSAMGRRDGAHRPRRGSQNGGGRQADPRPGRRESAPKHREKRRGGTSLKSTGLPRGNDRSRDGAGEGARRGAATHLRRRRPARRRAGTAAARRPWPAASERSVLQGEEAAPRRR